MFCLNVKKQASWVLLSWLALSSSPVHAFNIFGDHSASTWLSVIVTAPSWAPFMVLGDESGRGSDNSAAKKAAKEQEAQARKEQFPDAVNIAVVDKHGQTKTLYLPQDLQKQLNIQAGDQIDLEADERGVMLFKDGEAKHYIVMDSGNHLFKQEALKPY